MTICERMFLIMEQKGKKAADLCKILEIGTGQTTTWKKRNSDPPAKYIASICEFLEVTPEYLLTGTESNNDLNLNENEQEMLEKFKKLPNREQIKVIGIVEERLEKYCKIEQSKESCEIEQQSLTSKIG